MFLHGQKQSHAKGALWNFTEQPFSPDFIDQAVDGVEYHVPVLCLTGLKDLVPKAENSVCELSLEGTASDSHVWPFIWSWKL